MNPTFVLESCQTAVKIAVNEAFTQIGMQNQPGRCKIAASLSGLLLGFYLMSH